MNYSQFALRRGGAALSALRSPATLVAVWWGVVCVAALLWVWGKDPMVFPSPDEAVNRLAATLIVKHGRPFLHLPYADVENIVHPRFWLSLGDHAVPAYAPVALYVYALLTAVPGVGPFLLVATPASAVGAFAAGTARLLPKGRRFLSVFAPALGFPALYWILRPWLNISLLLVCLSWAFFCFASWRATGKESFLRAAMVLVSAGAAIRPDCAGYILPAVLCFTLAASPSEWKRIVVLVFLAGVLAVAVNLFLNWTITGKPFQGAYQILLEQEPDDEDATFVPGPFGTLLLPMGLPTFAHATKFVMKYWVNLGALRLLLAGQLAIVPLLWSSTWRQRAAFVAGLLVLVAFLVSRMSIDVYGAKTAIGHVHHSIPRYWAPVYLFAALPPLLYLGKCRSGLLLFVGTLVTFLVFARGLQEISVRQGTCLKELKRMEEDNTRWLDAVGTKVRKDALVFTKTRDKMLWSRWNLGTLTDMEHVAASMDRAMGVHLQVYMVEPWFSSRDYRALAKALKKRNLSFTRLDSAHGVYRVKANPPVAVGLSRSRQN